jgi:hypothetical protein
MASEPVAPDAAVPPAPVDATAGTVTAPLELEFQVAGAPVEGLTIECPESCGSVELAAHGGRPPYTFEWEDASPEPLRQVCASIAGVVSARVRDALGATHAAELPVQLAACATGQLCASNRSFEGTPTVGTAWRRDDFDAGPWTSCRAPGAEAGSGPKVVARASGDEFPAPTDGDSYLYLESNPPALASVGQSLCAPLLRGTAYSFKFDVAYAAEDAAGATLEPARLEVYASPAMCQRDELLWASPHLTTGFRTYCVTLKPRQTVSGLLLSPVGPTTGTAAVFVDHLVAAEGCP